MTSWLHSGAHGGFIPLSTVAPNLDSWEGGVSGHSQLRVDSDVRCGLWQHCVAPCSGGCCRTRRQDPQLLERGAAPAANSNASHPRTNLGRACGYMPLTMMQYPQAPSNLPASPFHFYCCAGRIAHAPSLPDPFTVSINSPFTSLHTNCFPGGRRAREGGHRPHRALRAAAARGAGRAAARRRALQHERHLQGRVPGGRWCVWGWAAHSQLFLGTSRHTSNGCRVP